MQFLASNEIKTKYFYNFRKLYFLTSTIKHLPIFFYVNYTRKRFQVSKPLQ